MPKPNALKRNQERATAAALALLHDGSGNLVITAIPDALITDAKLANPKQGISKASAPAATGGVITLAVTSANDTLFYFTGDDGYGVEITGGTAGQRITIVIYGDGATLASITFQPNFLASDKLYLSGSANAYSVSFIYDGTNWIETSRALELMAW